MKRTKAMKKSHDYLKRSGQGQFLKEKARNNADLTYMGLAHSIADLIQRGVNPDDVDFQKIDWGVSYANIRDQVKDLATQNNQDAKLQSEKKDEAASGMDKADAMIREARSERLENKASFIERGNPRWSRYVDQSRDAKKTFSKPFTKEEYRKWRRNQDKYDMQGIDSKRPKDERIDIKNYPFQKSRKSKIKEMKMENALSDGIEETQNKYADKISKMEIVDKKQKLKKEREKTSFGSSKDFSFDKTNASNLLNDSRSKSQVKTSNKGGTSERSNQQSLRDGYSSKKSEKTLDKWKGNYI